MSCPRTAELRYAITGPDGGRLFVDGHRVRGSRWRQVVYVDDVLKATGYEPLEHGVRRGRVRAGLGLMAAGDVALLAGIFVAWPVGFAVQLGGIAGLSGGGATLLASPRLDHSCEAYNAWSAAHRAQVGGEAQAADAALPDQRP